MTLRPLRAWPSLGLAAALLAAPIASADPAPPPSALCGPEARPDTFCMPTGLIERLLVQPMEVLSAERVAEGLARAFKLRLAATDPETGRRWVFDAKWKTFPRRGRKLNNDPRRELAADVDLAASGEAQAEQRPEGEPRAGERREGAHRRLRAGGGSVPASEQRRCRSR